MKSLRLHFALGLLIASALPVFGGALIQFDELGNGMYNSTPLVAILLAGGGIEYQGPVATGFYQPGEELIYDSDGNTLSDILKFVPSSFATDFLFYSLDSGSLPADTLTPPAIENVLGSTNEDASGNFHFANEFEYQGSSPETPEPSTVLLGVGGLAAMLGRRAFLRRGK